ncbi:fructose-bisphosphatase class II [Solirubrobacter soli]|uniref:fructose-bisphosphatase class II n=1 Tax=Solirubrobacter soli TaxID=363832 RepID=UPI0003FDAFF0|nr:fructose-bisphosphatase class II [Solirubrobacter soli]
MLAALDPTARECVRAAAHACRAHVGSGDAHAADAAATDAMRAALARTPGTGTVVIGEGEKDAAPMLFNGERLGASPAPAFDIAVDPLEGTSLCADDEPGAMTTIAFAAHGALWNPGPAHYMEKLVVSVKGVVDLREPLETNLAALAKALQRRRLRAVVLDKPRHAELIARLRAAGAEVTTIAAGDVGAAVLAATPDSRVDLLVGTGGTPEGVIAACAVKALGGDFQGRVDPQRPDEAQRVRAAGIRTGVLTADEIVAGPALFAAAAVTGGPLLARPGDEIVIRTKEV